MRNLRVSAVAAGLAAASLTAAGTAATANAAEGSAPDATPPACVGATAHPPTASAQLVTVRNGCAVTERVRVVTTGPADGSCLVLAPRRLESVALPLEQPHVPVFTGLQRC